jgi:large subunit ribosomal protein L13
LQCHEDENRKVVVDKTYYPKESEITNDWVVMDANGQNLGRFATQVAQHLLGKLKPNFTPGVEMGDFVVVVNCERVVVTGTKLEDKKYFHHTGFPGGIKSITLKDQLKKHPERVLEAAVWGMLPKTAHGRRLLKKLKIYAGPNHPHDAQAPKTVEA